MYKTIKIRTQTWERLFYLKLKLKKRSLDEVINYLYERGVENGVV